ncbi:LrgB family protein [Undibacterium cyanobacteriorum]|uniref:LrgB family protein n=1 Tax=Undibacterium cyanobacteriorum TaxID=3073561 RepID=A0ABY9RLR6_9BURK|nr:LrgB family protein [Undibacterium sp. 20NA77.5]WMW81342.1 LrgB family protein [Undibacterium sp. 20NA77.5]
MLKLMGDSPLWLTFFSLSLSFVAYAIALRISTWFRANPLANPVVLAVAMIILVLYGTDVSYQSYFAGAQALHFFLGPATVALAIPLAKQAHRLKRLLLPLFWSLLLGCVSSILCAFILTSWLGGSLALAISMAPKSATTPIAMAITEALHGYPAVSAAVVITTGIIGAIIARLVFTILHISSLEARGFALGVSAHGIGTARAFQLSSELGAYAGLGMGLNGMLTAVLTPVLVPLLMRWCY